MLNFASEELNDRSESSGFYDFSPTSSGSKKPVKVERVKLFADKLCVPPVDSPIARPRLIEHLEKSLAQFSATLVAGRAGMGKTLLAAEFARQKKCQIAWYKAETADTDWKIFSSYLLGSIQPDCLNVEVSDKNFDKMSVSSATESIAAHFSAIVGNKPLLIVLDDLHSVFDADWFTDFFNSFVRSLSPNIQMLLIARTLPPLPLWRLRSKQVLGVLDEKLLTCTLDEANELFRRYHLSPINARSAHKRTFGRIVKLREIAEKKSYLQSTL